MPPNTVNPPTLLGLPAELRLLVIEKLLFQDQLSLAHACKQLFQEVEPELLAYKDLSNAFEKISDSKKRAEQIREIALKSDIHARHTLLHRKFLDAILNITISCIRYTFVGSRERALPIDSLTSARMAQELSMDLIIDIVTEYPQYIGLLAGIKWPNNQLLIEVLLKKLALEKAIDPENFSREWLGKAMARLSIKASEDSHHPSSPRP